MMINAPWRAFVNATQGNDTLHGAGFLVDKRKLITCAHLVVDCSNLRVSFRQSGRKDLHDLPVRVVMCGPWRGPGTPGDIAVVEFYKDIDLPPAIVSTSTNVFSSLIAHGYPSGHGESGTMARLRLTSGELIGEWLQIEAIEGHSEYPRGGFSGAAVHDEQTGRVVGMITDFAESPGLRTGRMLPIESIRAYWEEFDDIIDLTWLTGEKRRELRKILSGAELDVEPEDLVRQVFPSLQRPRDLRSLWDMVRYVAEEVMGKDRLARFLPRAADHLELPETSRTLRHWIDRTLPARPDKVRTESIIVRIDEMTKGGYLLSFATSVDDEPGRRLPQRQIPGRENLDTAKQEIRSIVEAQLPILMQSLAGKDPLIEFVAPVNLLDEPLDEWRIDPGSDIPLRTYRLAVRVVDRQYVENGVIRDKWMKRSKELHRHPRAPAELLSCRPARAKSIYDWLESRREVCVLVPALRPSAAILGRIVVAGIPVVLWSSGRCSAPDHDSCERRRLMAELTQRMDAATVQELPGLVRKLRLDARLSGSKQERHRRWTLLWDYPDRLTDPPAYVEE